jgi:pectate lyase
MSKNWIALSCLAVLVACSNGDGSGVASNDAALSPDVASPAEGGRGSGGTSATGGIMATGGTTGTPAGTGGVLGTGGTTAAGGSSCTTPPDPSPLVGWAAESSNGVTTTTGGGSATPVTVATLADLQNAVKGSTAAVVYLKGVMAAGSVSIGSNKTVVGLCGAEIHGHVSVNGASNVIVRNLKIVGYAVGNCALDPSYDSGVGCSSGQDAISVQNGDHIWFDHCDISDGTDGNLDITSGADYVTVSWTKFHYTPRTDNSGSDSTGGAGHRYSNLVGGGDGVAGDVGKLNVTWHHNWWADNVMERQPRVRYGKNHVFNNLYSGSGDNYCVRAGIQAQILIESNVFTGVKSPHEFNNTSDQGTAYITAVGNSYVSTSGTKATGGGGTPFTDPPYAYTADATANLEAAIRSGAGPQ